MLFEPQTLRRRPGVGRPGPGPQAHRPQIQIPKSQGPGLPRPLRPEHPPVKIHKKRTGNRNRQTAPTPTQRPLRRRLQKCRIILQIKQNTKLHKRSNRNKNRIIFPDFSKMGV